jgi:hypothetical protein
VESYELLQRLEQSAHPIGVKVIRVHYTADPERDSRWVKQEKRKYSSQAAWAREQEIIHEAGGGQLLFDEILNRYADKIIIRDPNLRFRKLGSASQVSTTARRIPRRHWSQPLTARQVRAGLIRPTWRNQSQ